MVLICYRLFISPEYVNSERFCHVYKIIEFPGLMRNFNSTNLEFWSRYFCVRGHLKGILIQLVFGNSKLKVYLDSKRVFVETGMKAILYVNYLEINRERFTEEWKGTNRGSKSTRCGADATGNLQHKHSLPFLWWGDLDCWRWILLSSMALPNIETLRFSYTFYCGRNLIKMKYAVICILYKIEIYIKGERLSF